MDYEALIDEVQARGFNYLDDTRVGRYVNQAYQELCELMSWPFLEDSATGNAPLSITDARAILNVTDTTNKRVLASEDRRNLERIDPTLDDTGCPMAWYLDGTSVTVWPVQAVALSVRYLKVPVELAATTDEPVVPERFHDIIVDGAVARAQKDNDDYDAMQITRAEWQRQVDGMVASLMNRALDQAGRIFISEPKDW